MNIQAERFISFIVHCHCLHQSMSPAVEQKANTIKEPDIDVLEEEPTLKLILSFPDES